MAAETQRGALAEVERDETLALVEGDDGVTTAKCEAEVGVGKFAVGGSGDEDELGERAIGELADDLEAGELAARSERGDGADGTGTGGGLVDRGEGAGPSFAGLTDDEDGRGGFVVGRRGLLGFERERGRILAAFGSREKDAHRGGGRFQFRGRELGGDIAGKRRGGAGGFEDVPAGEE